VSAKEGKDASAAKLKNTRASLFSGARSPQHDQRPVEKKGRVPPVKEKAHEAKSIRLKENANGKCEAKKWGIGTAKKKKAHRTRKGGPVITSWNTDTRARTAKKKSIALG